MKSISLYVIILNSTLIVATILFTHFLLIPTVAQRSTSAPAPNCTFGTPLLLSPESPSLEILLLLSRLYNHLKIMPNSSANLLQALTSHTNGCSKNTTPPPLSHPNPTLTSHAFFTL